MKTIILKKSIFTAKFGVVFPAKTELRYFTDKETGKIYAEHPLYESIYTEVKSTNIVKRD